MHLVPACNQQQRCTTRCNVASVEPQLDVRSLKSYTPLTDNFIFCEALPVRAVLSQA